LHQPRPRATITHYERQDGTPGVAFDAWADEVQNAGGRALNGEDDRSAVAAGPDPVDAFDDNDLSF
jgi:hypothetical protein